MIYSGVFLLITVISQLLSLGNGEIFTAMADMESLLYAERDVIGVIDHYIQAENERLQKLKKWGFSSRKIFPNGSEFFYLFSFALEYQNRNKRALKDGSEFLMNPLNAYLVVKRLTSDWEYVESLMRHNTADCKSH